jgi:glycosyltransferase involved in cell wall biosynthesis
VDTVCHVITKLELGGAQDVALYTVARMDRARFRPILIAGPGGLLDEDAKRIPDVETVMLPWLGRKIHVFADLMALVGLIGLFRRYRPAIVHTHSSKAGILGRWAAWCAGVPVIVHTVHGYGITPEQSAMTQRCFMLLERVTGWITTQWIAVAEADVRKGRTWKLFDQNVCVIRPGIDPQPFSESSTPEQRAVLRREFGAGPDDWLIGTVACLKPQKAPQDFLALAKQVCAAVPQARFVLIGDGELRPAMESLIRQAGLQRSVRLAGWRRDISQSLRAMDVFVLTSHWEGLPRVILEARASGLPIVATRVGGVEEAMAGYRLGYLTEAGAIEALAASVLRFRPGRAPGKRGTGLNGETAAGLPVDFHIEEMLRRYEALYGALLQQAQTESSSHAVGLAR